MKTLTLLRHAKAEPDSSGGDYKRSLSGRGRSDARRLAEEIRALDLRYDLVLASPARRVVETVAEAGGWSAKFDERIYNAAAGDLVEIVGEVDDAVDRLLLVGHNPGLERLAARLTGNALEQMPTGTLVEIELRDDRWRDAGKRKGRLVRLLRPKDLA